MTPVLKVRTSQGRATSPVLSVELANIATLVLQSLIWSWMAAQCRACDREVKEQRHALNVLSIAIR